MLVAVRIHSELCAFFDYYKSMQSPAQTAQARIMFFEACTQCSCCPSKKDPEHLSFIIGFIMSVADYG